MKFEDNLAELETIVKKLEEGALPLDEALSLFEKGIKLTKSCRKILDDAERKVSVITEDGTLEEFPDKDNN